MSRPTPRTLFVGMARSTVAWYRCALPAMALGQDWVGVVGEPPELTVVTGVAEGVTGFGSLFDYEVVVLQQPSGAAWLKAIRRLQAAGVRVLFEIDDYAHGVRKLDGHAFAGHYGREKLEALELCMRAADGLICSTEFLARRYRRHNPETVVCRNGLDLKRYALTLPAREHVTVGWAGGTGHGAAVAAWLPAVATAMREDERARLVTVGERLADGGVGWGIDPDRYIAIPFTALDVYPAAMTQMDIALAPAGKGNFYRAKSDLRWLEASALGIPVIADPDVYPEIVDGETGFHARSPGEAGELLRALLADAELRRRVGGAARAHVREHRSIEAMAGQWTRALGADVPAVGERVA